MNDFSPSSRLWVYQSDRELSNTEAAEIEKLALEFVRQWTAHGHELRASARIYYNRFIVLAVDETQAGASGCSIDKSLAFIRGIEQQYGISLLDRTNVAYKQDGKVLSAPLSEFKKLLSSRALQPDTVVFNNMVTSKQEFDSGWETTVEKSWHSRLLVNNHQ